MLLTPAQAPSATAARLNRSVAAPPTAKAPAKLSREKSNYASGRLLLLLGPCFWWHIISRGAVIAIRLWRVRAPTATSPA